MLSYRHAFHAGNHADVLKHVVVLQIAEYLGEKPGPFWIIDTHAGAGRYALESAHARKLGEYRDGIARLWDRKGLPPAVADYVELVRMLNPDGRLRHYPGSPWLARQLLRESDRLRLYELHSSDVKLLQECFAGPAGLARRCPGAHGLRAGRTEHLAGRQNHCRRGLCQGTPAAPERRQGADDQVRAAPRPDGPRLAQL